MSAILLLPGFGGKYTSESITGVSSPGTVGADTIDVSRCSSFSVEVSAVSGSPTIQVEHSIDGDIWANLGNALTASAGTIGRFTPADGFYGKIRFRITGSTTSATLTVVGSPTAWSL